MVAQFGEFTGASRLDWNWCNKNTTSYKLLWFLTTDILNSTLHGLMFSLNAPSKLSLADTANELFFAIRIIPRTRLCDYALMHAFHLNCKEWNTVSHFVNVTISPDLAHQGSYRVPLRRRTRVRNVSKWPARASTVFNFPYTFPIVVIEQT